MSQRLSQSKLLAWYAESKRDLPWRNSNDAWKILLSEILLQQTQVSRGIAYWKKLVARFPTPQAMADAQVDEVLLLWQGAGYYSRARRLHSLSLMVCLPSNEGGYDGRLPQTAAELLKLPGVGPYTAAAVASIAYGEPVACVDGNIRRVMARQSKNPEPSMKEVDAWAQDILYGADAGNWNQALMELGATICTPRRAQCTQCPLASSCKGRETPTAYPLPKKVKRKRLDLQCTLRFDATGKPELVQRGSDGILAGMWGPPMAENLNTEGLELIGIIQHALSHRDLYVEVWLGSCSKGTEPSSVALSSLAQKILSLGE